MKRNRKATKISVFVSCIFLMLTLTWLTVSLPFALAARQSIQFNKQAEKGIPPEEQKEKTDNNGFANTEEKTSNNLSSLTEEYLHDHDASEAYPRLLAQKHAIESVPIYISFYGELISPPPDQA
ncbi:MAG: hypothetical protein JNL51_08065 [Chitinophagaceae bacterium]|nr:hypothetical protein [Chitinophagaceae bacterium]